LPFPRLDFSPLRTTASFHLAPSLHLDSWAGFPPPILLPSPRLASPLDQYFPFLVALLPLHGASISAHPFAGTHSRFFTATGTPFFHRPSWLWLSRCLCRPFRFVPGTPGGVGFGFTPTCFLPLAVLGVLPLPPTYPASTPDTAVRGLPSPLARYLLCFPLPVTLTAPGPSSFFIVLAMVCSDYWLTPFSFWCHELCLSHTPSRHLIQL